MENVFTKLLAGEYPSAVIAVAFIGVFLWILRSLLDIIGRLRAAKTNQHLADLKYGLIEVEQIESLAGQLADAFGELSLSLSGLSEIVDADELEREVGDLRTYLLCSLEEYTYAPTVTINQADAKLIVAKLDDVLASVETSALGKSGSDVNGRLREAIFQARTTLDEIGAVVEKLKRFTGRSIEDASRKINFFAIARSVAALVLLISFSGMILHYHRMATNLEEMNRQVMADLDQARRRITDLENPVPAGPNVEQEDEVPAGPNVENERKQLEELSEEAEALIEQNKARIRELEESSE